MESLLTLGAACVAPTERERGEAIEEVNPTPTEPTEQFTGGIRIPLHLSNQVFHPRVFARGDD